MNVFKDINHEVDGATIHVRDAAGNAYADVTLGADYQVTIEKFTTVIRPGVDRKIAVYELGLENYCKRRKAIQPDPAELVAEYIAGAVRGRNRSKFEERGKKK